jgi:hypothetical protein
MAKKPTKAAASKKPAKKAFASKKAAPRVVARKKPARKPATPPAVNVEAVTRELKDRRLRGMQRRK